MNLFFIWGLNAPFLNTDGKEKNNFGGLDEIEEKDKDREKSL